MLAQEIMAVHLAPASGFLSRQDDQDDQDFYSTDIFLDSISHGSIARKRQIKFSLSRLGHLYEASEISASPAVIYPIHIANPGSYTVWVRGMAPDAGGDSLHVSLDGQTTSDADQLTGFAGLDHVVQSCHCLFDRCFIVPAMDLIEIDVIRLTC